MLPEATQAIEASRALHQFRHPPVWATDLLNALLIIGLAFLPFPGDEFRPGGPAALVVVVTPALLLPLRRKWPISVLGACVALYGLASFTGTLSPGVVLATSIAMFRVAASSATRRLTVVAAATAVVSIIALSVLAAIATVLDARAFAFALTVAFAAAAGDASRSRREYIRAITERAERAEQTREIEARRRVTEERLRIARDLHDAVAHQIAVISLNAGVASSHVATRPEKAVDALATIRAAARTVLREIGDLMEMLRTETDSGGSTTHTPQRGLRELDTLLGWFAEVGLSVQIRREGDATRLTGAADLVAYRVIQEALTNAHKHGAERRAHILLRIDDARALIVVTNPVPDNSEAGERDRSPTGGHGLLGLRERVASVRGTVETGTASGGFRVAASLPLTKEEQ
ncbi:sensor histidine kinase [Microbacterium sp. ZW T5_45]|uniref:sensor histidine kinase n=1 Tax=Microbacterium sp. ZW T5_45 TaxID=3378080 RepID=UPI003851DCDD